PDRFPRASRLEAWQHRQTRTHAGVSADALEACGTPPEPEPRARPTRWRGDNHILALCKVGGAAKAVALGALLLPTAAAAAVSFVGFRLGSKDEEGWVSVLGYVVGAIGALSALMGVLAMMGVAVTPFTFTPKTSEVAALPAPAPA